MAVGMTSGSEGIVIYLETERLVLRRMDEADEAHLWALDSDPEVMRYINGGVPTPRQEVHERMLPVIRRWYEAGDAFGFWAAIEKSTGDFLGWFHFRPPHDPVPGIELGYRLKRPAWGHGFATEGSRAIIRKAFEELGIERVIAKTLAANLASQRVMQKAGLRFVEEFVETRISPPQPAVWYALDRAAYERGFE